MQTKCVSGAVASACDSRMNTPEQSMDKLRESAERGNAPAQNDLGECYFFGRGVSQNNAEAFKWYHAAAVQGYAWGQFNLGWMLNNGRGVAKDQAAAIHWFRKAAEQGHEESQKTLSQLGVTFVAATRKASKTTKVVAELPDKKAPARSSVRGTSAECKPLLEACTPQLYRNNAFRIVGLPVDASTRDIKRRIDDLKAAEEINDATDEHKHAFALEPAPSLEMIRESAQRLQDPERRIIDEFFWFWPTQWGGGKQDAALVALSLGDKDTAFTIWSDSMPDDHAAASLVAKHNLAVMYHLVATDSEQYSLEFDLSQKQLDTITEYWRRSLQWWHELENNDAFWSLVTERIRLLDDPRLTTGFARKLRATLPEAINKIMAQFAVHFVESGKIVQATNHTILMRELCSDQDAVEQTLSCVTQPLKDRVHAIIGIVEKKCRTDPANSLQHADELLAGVQEPVRIIQRLLLTTAHVRIDICDSVADALMNCESVYEKETKDWAQCLCMLEEALKFAESKETRSRIEVKQKDVTESYHLDHVIKDCTRIRSQAEKDPSSGASNAKSLIAAAPKLLETIATRGASNDLTVKAKNIIAVTLYGCAIDYGNKTSDWRPCVEILQAAERYVSDDALRKRIQENLATASNNAVQQQLRERCWFCKRNKATVSGMLKVPMYGDVARTPTYGGTHIEWRHRTVDVPRCDVCREAHSKNGASWAGMAAGAAAGTALLPIVGTVIGAIGGFLVGNKVDNNLRLPAGVSPESTKKEFPDVQELLKRGWDVGEKPTS